MFEVIAEFLFKPLVGLIRFLGLIAIEGAIFRPIYWIGWCILRCVPFGNLPKSGINKPDYEMKYIEYLTWIVRFLMIIIFGVTSFA